MTKRIAQLTELTSLSLAQKQADMMRIVQAETALQHRLAELDEAVRLRAQSDVDLAYWAGVDPKWHVWLEQMRGQIQTEMARLRAAKEELRPDLAKAFGRDQVANRLLQSARQKDQRILETRQERMG